MNIDSKPYNILIIEDNPGDFVIVEDLLYEVIKSPSIYSAVNFKEAEKMIAEHKDGLDVILLDLTLPDKSGQTLIKEMVILARCPVIILTGYSDIGFSINSLALGIFDYLLKDDLDATKLYKSILYSIERRKNIAALQESEKQYSDLFYLSPQPMWVFDADTLRFSKVNKAALELYGYTEQEFLLLTLHDVKAKADPLTDARLEKIRDNEYKFVKSQAFHQKKSGEVMELEVFSNPIKTGNGFLRLSIAIDVTEKKLYEHRITRAIIQTQEDERYEIGSELHDNVCQLLATSQMSFGMAKSGVSSEKTMFFSQGREYITMALNEIRELSHRLAPAFLDNTTLEEAITRLLNGFNISGEFDIRLTVSGGINKENTAGDIQLNLYRILQEQLRNIWKYAKASEIQVELTSDGDDLTMRVADNGVGFDTAVASEGIGIANIKRRAELFSGKCSIVSSPGHGCEVIINIPVGPVNI